MDAVAAGVGADLASLGTELARRQAVRDAQQAEARANALQAASARERRVAERASQRAQSLDQQAGQAGDEASRLRRNVAASRGFSRLSEQFAAARVNLGGEAAAEEAPAPEPTVTPVGTLLRAAVATYASASTEPVVVGAGLSASA